MATETVTDAPAQGSAAAPVVPPQNQHPRSDLASLNAEALNAHFERGRQAGIAEGVKREKARAKAIRDACPGKPEMALDAISGEQDAGAVKLAYDATLRAETTAATRIAELEEQNRRKDALLAIGGHAGVGVDVSDEDVPAVDAKAVAEREWDTKPAVRKGFSSKDRYVAFRVRELNGTVVSR